MLSPTDTSEVIVV